MCKYGFYIDFALDSRIFNLKINKRRCTFTMHVIKSSCWTVHAPLLFHPQRAKRPTPRDGRSWFNGWRYTVLCAFLSVINITPTFQSDATSSSWTRVCRFNNPHSNMGYGIIGILFVEARLNVLHFSYCAEIFGTLRK